MSGLRASLFKDCRLLLKGSGWWSILLPVLLFLALGAGMGDYSQQTAIQPFAIAVRDLDHTLMSRSLVGQMEQIELFSEVITAREDQSDLELLQQGAAAVVTIPKDFFYTMYTMDNQEVPVTLNGSMPLESQLFGSMFESVMGIIQADQTALLGVYQYCYGDLTPALEAELYEQSSQRLVWDALSRQAVFDGGVTVSDVQGALERRLFASTLSVLCLFFALAAAKTVPQELRLGLLARYRSAGGGLGAFALSKLLCVLVLAVPALGLLLAVFGPKDLIGLALLGGALLLCAFCLMLCLALWAWEEERAQRWGNLYLLVSLLAGGGLYPLALLPKPLQWLASFTLPYYAGLGVELIAQGGNLLSWLWPLAGLALGAVLLTALQWKRYKGILPYRKTDTPIYSILFLKGNAMSGGAVSLIIALTLLLLCGAGSAYALRQESQESLVLAVVDKDGSVHSQEMLDSLGNTSTVKLISCTEKEGERLLLTGQTEGLLTLSPGFGAALDSGAEQLPMTYRGTASSHSARAAREMIAGRTAILRSRVWALEESAQRMDGVSQEELFQTIDRLNENQPPLFRITTAQGKTRSLFQPSSMGFAVLSVTLCALTWAAWTGREDCRRVTGRLRAQPRGRLLARGTDLLALFGLTAVCMCVVLLPAGIGTPQVLWTVLCFSWCMAALALLLTGLSPQAGRVDTLAPFLALILCVLGGCFVDLSQLSPMLQRLAALTPQGMAIQSNGGGLLLLGGVFFGILYWI